jgi:hypothetical protein
MRLLLLVISFGAFFVTSAQSVSPKVEFDKNYYLQKSRQQKTLGTISLITGSATALVGGYLWVLAPIAGLSESGDVEGAERTGKTMVAIGGTLIGVSIPLFIASGKNREKASLNIGTGSIYVPFKGHSTQMTVGFQIPIR